MQRTRWGGNLSLDWRPADSTTLYVRGLYSKFDDTELRTRLVFKPGAPPAITGVANGFHVPGTLPGEGETQLFLNTSTGEPGCAAGKISKVSSSVGP